MKYGLDIENHPQTPLGELRAEGVGLTVNELASNFNITGNEVKKQLRHIHQRLYFFL